MGQEKETTNTRMIVRDSFDEKLEKMQKSKTRIINGVMKKKSDRLSLEEIMGLSGNVKYVRYQQRTVC